MTKRFLSLLMMLTALMPALMASEVKFGNESLSYRATYKWGIIQKTAGRANLTLTRQHDNTFRAVLTAATLPWADPIFSVRDTLIGSMAAGSMHPLLYDKSTHEGGVYRHDVINYTYTPTMMTAHCERFKVDKRNNITVTDTVMSAPLPGVDMLSVYYFVRALPYENMQPGEVANATIFSGTKKENLSVTYTGITTVKLDGKRYECYQINFTFSSERMKNSSAPMKAWIRRDGTRIPIKLEGELPIGKIQVLWNGD